MESLHDGSSTGVNLEMQSRVAVRGKLTAPEVTPDSRALLAFAQLAFCLGILVRLFDTWPEVSEGWRLLVALAIGLFSTNAGIMLVHARRLQGTGPAPGTG